MSLAEEFLKAGLIDKKKAKRLKHEKRVEQKKNVGNPLLEKQIAEQKAEQKARKEKEKALAEAARKKREEKAQQDRLENLALSNKVEDRGPIRHHFITRDQHLLFLEVSSEMNYNLSKGTHAIVEVYSLNDYVIVPKAVAKKMEAVDANTIRFFKV